MSLLPPLSRHGSETYLYRPEEEDRFEPENISNLSSMNISNLFSDNPPNDYPYQDEMYRHSTFEDAMEGLDGTILSRCGFFYDSRHRNVECFSCHVRHRFTNREDISLYRHLATCDFANGNPTQNVPRSLNNNRGRTSASVSAARETAVRIRSGLNSSRSSRRQVNSPRRSQTPREDQSYRSQIEEEQPANRGGGGGRGRNLERFDHSPRDRREVAPSPRPRIEEIPRNSNQVNRNQSASFSRNFDLRTPDERSREAQFPCRNPRHPHMRDVEDRVRTFSRGWRPFSTECSPREIAEAGMLYVGPDDETVCWYCGGGLENWEPQDNPWEEHAKWHPVCEYLLQKKGTEYVQRINRQNLRMPIRNISTTGGTRSSSRRSPTTNTTTTSSSRGSFRPSSPPPDFQIFPPVSWERTETRSPGGHIRTEYRGPGLHVSMSTTEEPQHIRGYTNSATRRRDMDEVARALLSTTATLVGQMGFSQRNIEAVTRRRLNTVGTMYNSVTDFVDDLQAYENQLSTERPQSTTREVQSGPEVVFEVPEESGGTRQLCFVCETRQSNTVFTPCGHFTTCWRCAESLERCNRCGSRIENRIRARRE